MRQTPAPLCAFAHVTELDTAAPHRIKTLCLRYTDFYARVRWYKINSYFFLISADVKRM